MPGSLEPFLAEISTPRLMLWGLQTSHLNQLIENPDGLEKAFGFAISRDVLTPRVQHAIQSKLKKMEAAPIVDYPWFTYWMIRVREVGLGAGLIGFKGISAGPSDVEIGYGIDPACQNRNYMTEAVLGLSAWAFNDPRCTGIYAAVLKTNPASSRVLEKAGFGCVSVRRDEIFWRLPRPA